MIANKEKWNLPRFPNAHIHAVTIEMVAKHFGPEVVVFMDKQHPEMRSKIEEVTLYAQRYYPQGHPFWLEFRECFRLTGSVAFHLMLGCGPIAGKKFSLPKMMISSEPKEKTWTDQMHRLKYGRIPRTPMDPGGLCNCECGKTHEASAVGAFLKWYEFDPNLKYEEIGSIQITVEMVNRRGVYNVFDDNKPFTTLPTLTDSPDGRVTMTCIKTAQKVVRALELKSRTEFMPWWTPIFAGADFMQMNDASKDKWQEPFEKPKNYYMQQSTVFHLLALELDEVLFCSHTTHRGMKIWMLKFNVRYVSLVISFLNLIYNRFIVKHLQVPVDWAYHQDDQFIRDRYDEWVTMTNSMCDTAVLYDSVPPAITTSTATEMADPNHETMAEFMLYPNVPSWPAPMTLFCYHTRALFPLVSELKVYWIGDYAKLDQRVHNLLVVPTLSPLLHFTADILLALMQVHEFQAAGDQLCKLFVTQHELVQRAESFIVKVLALVCRYRNATHLPGIDDVSQMNEHELEHQATTDLVLPGYSSSWKTLCWWNDAKAATLALGKAAIDKPRESKLHERIIIERACTALSHPTIDADDEEEGQAACAARVIALQAVRALINKFDV